MKFELEPHNRNVPESELIADLKRVANELQKNSFTAAEYTTRGRVHSNTISQRFGSWNKALEQAGLVKTHIFYKDVSDEEMLANLKRVAGELGKSSIAAREYDAHGHGLYHSTTLIRRFGSWPKVLEHVGLVQTRNVYKNVSDDDLIADLKRVASKLQKSSVTIVEYDEHGKFGSGTLMQRFDRSWSKAVKLAGLAKSKNLNTPNEELFTNLAEIWTKLGRQPKGADLTSQTSKFSCDTYSVRFGSWRKALEAFVTWANEGEAQAIEAPPQKHETQPAKSSIQQKVVHKPVLKPEVFRHRTPRGVNNRLRIHVILRDNCTCRICGISPATKPGTILEVDHIKSWDSGGETVIENLQTLCSRCNGGKSNLDLYKT